MMSGEAKQWWGGFFQGAIDGATFIAMLWGLAWAIVVMAALAGCSSLAQPGPTRSGPASDPASVHACAAAIVATALAHGGNAFNEPPACYNLTAAAAYVKAQDEAAKTLARPTS